MDPPEASSRSLPTQIASILPTIAPRQARDPPRHRRTDPRRALHRNTESRTRPHRLPPPLRCCTVKVARDGLVTLGHRQSTSIGIEWAGTHVDVIRDDLDVMIIHDHHLIRRLRINPNRRYQPSGKRPGAPRRPRLLSDKS